MTDERLRRHRAATSIIEQYEKGQSPFVLMLSSFRSAHLVAECKYARAPFTLQDYVHRNLKHGVRAVSLRGDLLADISEAANQATASSNCPALTVPHERWQELTTALISRAAAIVCEVWFESSGICWELQECRNNKREHDTIVVIPHPDEGYKIKDFDNFRAFNRIVLTQELPYIDILEHPSTTDLFRLIHINALGDRAPAHFDPDVLALTARRPQYVGAIAALTKLASAYADGRDFNAGAMYFQSVINIAVYFASMDLPVLPSETEATVVAAINCAYCLNEIGKPSEALKRLELAEDLINSVGGHEYLARIRTLRDRIAG